MAQRGYFKDPAFINYLAYLQYWSKPNYVKFIKFPVCLHFLELLQHESFRKEIVKGEAARYVDDQSILQWQDQTRKREKILRQAMEEMQTSNINASNINVSNINASILSE